MTKQELDTLGYTYTNLTSGYVGLNYDTLFQMFFLLWNLSLLKII